MQIVVLTAEKVEQKIGVAMSHNPTQSPEGMCWECQSSYGK